MAIPMTQLGGRALNHSSASTEAEYDRLRDAARHEASLRNSCFDRSRHAYESGDGAGAKQLSEEGKEHGRKMDQYNRQASEYIFRENNAEGRVASDTIDLHGQFVEEAEDILEKRIRAAQAQGQTHLHVIVGKGNHSPQHIQKIKPRVEHICQELGLQYNTEENAGRIYINLQGGSAANPPPFQGGPQYGGGYDNGYQQPHHGGQHQGGQQHGGQQQHHGGGGQQQQDQADDTGKLLGMIFRALKKIFCAR